MTSRRAWIAAAALYTALALINVRTLLPVFSTALPNDTGDPGLITWMLWWNAHAVPFTERWWNAPMFFPMPGAVALSETFLGLLPFSSPLQWLGLTAVTTHNVLYVISFPAAALAAHALVRRLTGRHDVALIAGLAYGFSPYRASQMPHLHLLVSCWMPLALLALHRYLSDRRPRDLVLLDVCWLLNAMTTGYYLVFFAVLFALWMIWFARRIRDWAMIAVAVGLASLPILPILSAYGRFQQQFGISRDPNEIQTFSADLSAVWAISPHAWIPAHWSVRQNPEGELYAGAVVYLLVAAGAIAAWRTSPVGRRRRVQTIALAAGLVTAAAAGLAWLTGGGHIEIGGVTLFSLTRPYRAMSYALWLLAIAALLDRRLLDVWRRRSPFVFYTLAAIAMIALALGPVGRVFGATFMDRAPYSWLMSLPGGHSLRVPARFGMLWVLCVSIAAALGLRRLTPRGAPRALVAVLAIGVALEGWVPKMVAAPVPPYVDLGGLEPTAAVLEVPIRSLYTDTAAMLRATHHQHAVVNGFSGYVPAHYGPLQTGLDALDPAVLAVLQRYGPLGVLIDRSSGQEDQYIKYLNAIPGAQRLYRTPVGVVYRLPPLPPAPQPAPGERLPIAQVAVSTLPKLAPFMLDGRLDTQWQTPGPQEPNDFVAIDLDRVREVTRVEMDLAGYNLNYPRRLRIDAVDAAGAATPIWDGPTEGQALVGGLTNPRAMPVSIDLPRPVSTPRLVLTVLSSDPVWFWSIAELKVYGR